MTVCHWKSSIHGLWAATCSIRQERDRTPRTNQQLSMVTSTSHTALENLACLWSKRKTCPWTKPCFSFHDQQGLMDGLKVSVRRDQLIWFILLLFWLLVYFLHTRKKKKKISNTQVFNKYFICLAHVSISLFHRADEQENNWDCKYFEVQRGKLMPTQMYKETCNIRSNLQEYI